MLASIFSVDGLISVLMVAIGLGMVIFVHELGHFAVAKWCNVQVERFSIGFGPILWSRTWGETEYALSAIPFGGYVKMLGQDDLDPGQENSSDIAENPRSYTAKSVPQRMAIISAGVIMNVITGYLFYVGAMWLGTTVTSNRIGFVQPGMPAWVAGIDADDEILSINGRPVSDFVDVTRGTALSTGRIQVRGRHVDGTEYSVAIDPDLSGNKRVIGVVPQDDLAFFPKPRGDVSIPTAIPGSPADLGESGFQHGDRVIAVNGQAVSEYAEMRDLLEQYRGVPVEIQVRRGGGEEGPSESAGKEATVTVPPQLFRSLGLRMQMGEIVAVRSGSPAEKQGLQKEDRIIRVQGPMQESPLEVGRDIDPARLPDLFADLAGQPVVVTVEREGPGGETKSVTIVPEDRRNWTTEPGPGKPFDIPAIGVAFHFVPTVISVDPDSPADKAGVKTQDRVTHVEFIKPETWPETLPGETATVEIGENGWANVLWMMQTAADWPLQLTVTSPGSTEPRKLTMKSAPQADWALASDRGMVLAPHMVPLKADSPGEAFRMGSDQTRDSAADIYLTLRGLFTGNISPKELHGPIGILSIGVEVASSGFARFLLFLGFLSINLAVLNFLPIPVLDGGHMVFLIWEGIARKRPSERVYATAMYLGLLFVLGLMGYVIFLDIMRTVS
jgi:regulator of sigma E protease